jgi:hypothetical protein
MPSKLHQNQALVMIGKTKGAELDCRFRPFTSTYRQTRLPKGRKKIITPRRYRV